MRIAIVTLLLALGCVGSPVNPAPRKAWFDPNEYAPYTMPGSGSISGQAFLKTRGGDVKYAAGNTVVMNPVTAYSTEWLKRTVLGGQYLQPPDPRTQAFHWTTMADGEGRFTFKNVAAGSYYVATAISWYVSEYRQSGGWAWAKVRVRDGEQVEGVLLTDRPAPMMYGP